MDLITYVITKHYTDKRIAEVEKLGFKAIIVDELPLIGQKNTIYLIKDDDKDFYEEYLWVENQWRKIAYDVDLSGYATIDYVDGLLNKKQDKLIQGLGIIINNNNEITYDPEEISSVEYVDANISDTMSYVIQEDRAEHVGRVAGDNLLKELIEESVQELDQQITDLGILISENYVTKNTIATDSILGLVLSSTEMNKIKVLEDGTMEVNSVGVNKLENVENVELIFNSNE